MPRVTEEGLVEIPGDVREALGIESGDEVRFTETDAGYVVEKIGPLTADGEDPFERYRGIADADRTARDAMRRLRRE